MSQEKTHLSIFEKYLALWVVVCMAIGIYLSQNFPALGQAFNAWQIRGISVPIGVLLFLMMYPALLNIQTKELKKLMKSPKPILLTTISNWVVAPIITAYLAKIFLNGYDQLIVAAIRLGSSPCTARRSRISGPVSYCPTLAMIRDRVFLSTVSIQTSLTIPVVIRASKCRDSFLGRSPPRIKTPSSMFLSIAA